MDHVLGLSITPAAARLVLIEGATGDGDTVDHDVIDIATVRAAADTAELLHTVLRNRVIAAAAHNKPHSIGVTWTAEAACDGTRLLEALAAAGFEDFLAVSEWDAADALATGIAGLAGCDDAGVCIVEPHTALVAVVNPQGALVDRIDRRVQGHNSAELVGALVPMFDAGRPDAVFVFGSARDLDVVLSQLRSAMAPPVVSAAGADLALAKGAALAAARALSGWETQAFPPAPQTHSLAAERESPVRPRVSGLLASARGKVGALTSVLAAAVLTFVVSLALALGLHLTPQSDQSPANASGEPPIAANAPVVEAAPGPARFGAALSGPIAPPPEAAPTFDPPEAAPPPVYGPIEPAPEAPAPEPVYVPPEPAPVYIPPNTPAYQPPPQPRLRDRIIEKIPILNRFHQPQYP